MTLPTKTLPFKYGNLTFFEQDEFVGKSILHYGEFCDFELNVFRRLVKPGDTVLDVGANIGAYTVPMAQHVGPRGKVYAFEPQPEIFKLLSKNVRQNQLQNRVKLFNNAVGNKAGTIKMLDLEKMYGFNYGGVPLGTGDKKAKVVTIDSLHLEKVTYMKIDVEGMERYVIAGAKKTIKKHRPFLYVENDRPENCNQLVSDIIDLGYRLYWHRPLLFNRENWRKNDKNLFSGIISLNMVCIPEELNANVPDLDEIADLRMDAIMYERELARIQRIDRNLTAAIARNAAHGITIKPDLLVKLQIIHYLNLLKRHDECFKTIDEVLSIDPDNAGAKTMRALYNLQHGIWDWEGYEIRFKQKNIHTFGGDRAPPNTPKWDGKPTTDTVLIWAEQGFGDSIMFTRFIPEALRRAPNLILEIQPSFYELYEMSEVVPEGSLFRMKRAMPKPAAQCSLPSLPYVLGADDAMMHKYSQRPYLKVDQTLIDVWRKKSTPKIGLCTHGASYSERPYSRNIDVMQLKQVVDDFGPVLTLDNDKHQFESFSDTAAAIMTLDVVITVDTSIAHLSGALGVPTFLLLAIDPDFRWGNEGQATIWYPCMTILRQQTLFDWKPVIADLHKALEDFYAKKDRLQKVA